MVEASQLRGSIKTIAIESQALGARRKLTVYMPPNLVRGKASRVVYAADGERIERYARVLEPLILLGKVPPIVLIAAHSGGYLGGPDSKGYDTKKDLRAQEYFPGINSERFAKHESFFCSEVVAWAEREWNVSAEAKDRALFGYSNGARFVFEMAIRHPDRFGSVLAFSVPGGGPITLPNAFKTRTHFYLEAGTWEPQFQAYTSRLAETLRKSDVTALLRLRVGGHDEAIWRGICRRAALGIRLALIHFDSPVRRIGSEGAESLIVIGTFQIRLRGRHRLDGSLHISVSSDSLRSILSPASAFLASGTVILNSGFGGLTRSPVGESSLERMPSLSGVSSR